ncbi:MAG: TrkH family potassium uptake protein, partial [Planctomycetes bacterium]|nr:TrkH family potassium uptake protein [Planctomycetota bacterium]
PFLSVGGMQLFHSESSDRSEKVVPRLSTVASAILLIYVSLIAACALLFWLFGMTGMESVVHAVSSVATGGFSTSDSSVGLFRSPAIEWIAIIFMLAGALPFVIYIRLTRGYVSAFWRDSQIRLLILIVLSATVALTAWLSVTSDLHWLEAFRLALFNVTSIVTTTGFVSADYSQWGGFAVTVFFLLTFCGGCTGSTSGGIKIFRFEILLARLRVQMARLVQPNGVFPLQYQGRAVPDDVPAGVIAFIALYISCFVVLSLLLSALGLDFVTAVSGAAACLGNVGPGLGPIIGPGGTFAPLPDTAKWLLALAMVLGRLELFTFLVLFTPRFWRH